MKKLDDLAAVVPPPSKPKVRLDETSDWIELFGVIGTRLPQDFVQFHKLYGEGFFYSLSHKRSAGIDMHGCTGKDALAFHRSVAKRLSELRLLKESKPKSVPAALYWEPNGLLPWAITTNDTDLCWQVHGELVDNWPIVALRQASGDIEKYDVTMTEFLRGICDGSICSSLMPKGLPGEKGVSWESSKYG